MGVSLLQQVVFWLSIAVESAILLRGVQAKLIRRFSLFYGYLAFVLLSTLVEYVVKQYFTDAQYSAVYWPLEFASAFIGCAIIFELYRQSLRPYPLLASMANKVMLFVLALVIARFLAGINWSGVVERTATLRLLERDLRITQAVFLCGLLVLAGYYSVSMGRNLKGLILGYGAFLGLNMVELTLRGTLGQPFHATLMFLQPATYDLVLMLWLAMLWSKDAVAQRAPSAQLQQDYAQLVAATRKRMAQTEEQLIRIIRP